MSTIKSRWNDANYEVGARTMEHFHGSDFQREPPLVSDTLPAARIFNWRIPALKQPCISQVIHISLQLGHFIRLTISDFAWPMMCRFSGCRFSNSTCQCCGNYRY